MVFTALSIRREVYIQEVIFLNMVHALKEVEVVNRSMLQNQSADGHLLPDGIIFEAGGISGI